MNKLQGKTAVITGGSSGIGLATAKEFIAAGAKVIITGRKAMALDKALEELGPNAGGIVADSADMNAIRNLNKQVSAIFSGIDILFINAGIAWFAPIEMMDEGHFDEQFNINVKGSYFTIQQLLPLMKEGGSIVINASVNAHIGRPNASVYGATKAALLTLARNLSAELLDRKIRVNAISPGPVATPFHLNIGVPQDQLDRAANDRLSQIPIGRFADPAEIARIAVFFASDDSRFLLGSELIADGGMSIH